MERTRSEMHVPTNNLMGLLRCMPERQGRRSFSGYKKRFWVVNEAAQRLEVYKNDQAHIPLAIIHAIDIRGVIYAGDKQNRFYVLIVELRRQHIIKFRMNSSDEREAWSTAISKLIDTYSTNNRRHGVLQLVARRTRVAGQSLSVKIVLDAAQLLSDIPDDLLQYVLEAVDLAIENVSALVRTYGKEPDAPQIYILYVQSCVNMQLSGPQYDPTKRSVSLQVGLYRDALSHVRFLVTRPEEVLRITQSNVFRSPLIEGWIETEPGCAAACQSIRAYLQVKSGFAITFQWGEKLSDTEKVARYLQRFVNEDFFLQILQIIRDTVAEIEATLEDSSRRDFKTDHISLSVSPERSPNAKPRHHQGHPDPPPQTALTTSNPGTAATGACHHPGSISDELSGTHAATRSAHNGSSAVGHEGRDTVIHLLSDHLTGLGIVLSHRTVEEFTMPPRVMATHSFEYEQRCHLAFLLVARYKQIFSQPLSNEGGLHDQLFEVAFHALLSHRMNALSSCLSLTFDRKVKVIVLWDKLLLAYVNLSCPLFPRDLPRLVNTVSDIYLPRAQHLVQMLKSMPAKTSSPTANASMFDTFCYSVSAIVVEFVPLPSAPEDHLVFPTPAVQEGMLKDTFVCAPEARSAALLAAVSHQRNIPVRQAPHLIRNVCMVAAMPKLGLWCDQYFSIPEHIKAADRQFVDDELDVNSDFFAAGPLDTDFGDAVANERSAETRVLNMQRVVNLVYDSQGSSFDLKISAEEIRQAIDSLAGAFPGRRISKHDLNKVLTANLHRMRTLYSRAVDGETTCFLTEMEAMQLLHEFCEYEESELDLLAHLHALPTLVKVEQEAHAEFRRPMRTLSTMLSQRVPTVFSSPTNERLYDYQSVAHVALNCLLPKEAILARKAWRVGFLFGLENTGKTLISNCLRGVVSPTVATVGLSKQVVAFEEWVFALKELGGRESFRTNWKFYAKRIEQVDFLVFVVDSQDRRSFHEAHMYLRDVTTHFRKAPLLVIFNNHRNLPRPVLLSELATAMQLSKLRRSNPSRRVFICTCDITVVHSANSIIPSSLRLQLQGLSQVLHAAAPPHQTPSQPKRREGGPLSVQPAAVDGDTVAKASERAEREAGGSASGASVSTLCASAVEVATPAASPMPPPDDFELRTPY